MFIKNIYLKNIKSINELEINFSGDLAGWHVFIGDNGSGKSTILKAVAAALIGPSQVPALNIVWENWLQKGTNKAEIRIGIEPDWDYDHIGKGHPPKDKLIINSYFLEKKNNQKFHFDTNQNQKSLSPLNYNWGNNEGWFSVAYGPFRRFTGGDEKRNKVYHSSPKAGAHLSLFGEDVALTEALTWLSELENKRLRKRKELYNRPEVIERSKAIEDQIAKQVNVELGKPRKKQINQAWFQKLVANIAQETARSSTLEELDVDLTFTEGRILHHIKKFINGTGLLPNEAQFEGFDIEGNATFIDGNGIEISVYQMSDGYRSVLSLTFELIRQLVDIYGEQKVFAEAEEDENFTIKVPGVVLIDEIDAHLHPTWQVRIGDWFTKYFPNLQFIITTHSPLICRASKKGSIWRLGDATKGESFGEVTGIEKERLIYGNILDAYGTELFGESPVRSIESKEKVKRLGQLNMQHALGDISEDEESERKKLLKVLSTDDPVS